MPTSEPPDSPDDHPIFPQEIFDRLIDLVELESFRDSDLLKISLVSKRWAHHSRKRIFSQVKFSSKTHFQLWCKNITPGPGGPSSLVRVLILSQLDKRVVKWITPGNLLEGEEHLMSFTELKGLIVFDLRTLDFRDRALLSQCFRVIGQGLHFVRLHHVTGSPQTLTSLIRQFPTITTLSIEYYTDYAEMLSEGPTGETDGQFQGSLRLLSINPLELGVIDSIARLPLRYKEVHLTSSLFFAEPYNRLLSACAPTLERLRIIDIRGPRTRWANSIDSKGITVVNCTELQMVYLGTSKKPGSMVESFLKSVDPSNLRELVFELIWDKYENDDITSVIDIPAWESIDGALCTLASRIRERHSERRLTVVLSLVAPPSTDLRKVKTGTLFSEFRKEGSIVFQRFVDHLPPGVYSKDMPLLAFRGPQ